MPLTRSTPLTLVTNWQNSSRNSPTTASNSASLTPSHSVHIVTGHGTLTQPTTAHVSRGWPLTYRRRGGWARVSPWRGPGIRGTNALTALSPPLKMYVQQQLIRLIQLVFKFWWCFYHLGWHWVTTLVTFKLLWIVCFKFAMWCL